MKSAAQRLIWAILFLLATLLLTFLGFYFSWRQVHSPDWTRFLAIALLLPYAATRVVFHWFAGPQALSTPVYYASFLIGTLLQLLYYYAIFRLLRLLFRR